MCFFIIFYFVFLDDVLRIKATPKISEEIKEHLEYKINKTTETSGTISMS